MQLADLDHVRTLIIAVTKLTLDFHTNKRIIEEVALIPSKPLRNKVQSLWSLVS